MVKDRCLVLQSKYSGVNSTHLLHSSVPDALIACQDFFAPPQKRCTISSFSKCNSLLWFSLVHPLLAASTTLSTMSLKVWNTDYTKPL